MIANFCRAIRDFDLTDMGFVGYPTLELIDSMMWDWWKNDLIGFLVVVFDRIWVCVQQLLILILGGRIIVLLV